VVVFDENPKDVPYYAPISAQDQEPEPCRLRDPAMRDAATLISGHDWR
jgi:hypothetical protein